MSENKLIILPIVLKERTSIHTNVDDKLIAPEIKIAQDMYIEPVLGTKLFNKILTDIPTLTGNYKTLVDNYVIDTLCWYTMMFLAEPMSFQLWNKGVLQKGSDGDNRPSLSDVQRLSEKYRIKAEWYADRLRKYLMQDNGSMFPEYLNNGDRIDELIPERNVFNSPLYLGDGYSDEGTTGLPTYKDHTRCR